jgi:hypothetical protein
MRNRSNWILGTTTIVLIATLSGCSVDESVAGYTARANDVPSAAPTFAELDKVLSLDEEDAGVVKNALSQWREATVTSTKPRREARLRQMEFVATVTPHLDDTQLNSLVSYLVARQDARRDAMRTKHQARAERRFDRKIDRKINRIERHADAHIEKRVEWLDRTLELSDTQASGVKAAMTAKADARKASLEALQDDTITREQMRDQMRTSHEAFEKSLKGILTAEQAERLEILQRLMPRRRHHA